MHLGTFPAGSSGRWLMPAVAGAIAAACLLPVAYVVWSTASLGPAEAYDFLVRPRIGELLWNTGRLLVGGVALSVVFGVCGAWVVERTSLPLSGWWHGALCAPLAIPAFVNGYAWVATTHAVQSYLGAVLVVSLSYYPLVYLPTVAALRRLDPSLEEVAAVLGRRPREVFLRVVLPTVAPAVLGGALLVGLHLLAEYGALQLLNYPTLTTAILQQYGTAFNGPAATLLAGVLLLACLGLLALEMLIRGPARRARVGSGTARPTTRLRLGRGTVPVVVALGVFVALAVGLPAASLVRWLVRGASAELDLSRLLPAAGTSVALAAVAGVVATAAAVPVVWQAVRRRTSWSLGVERVTYVTSALPGVVVALALVTVAIGWLPGLYQTVPLLVAAYVILFLPRALVAVRGVLELVPPRLEEVALSLGLTRAGVMRRVTLPLLLPGLATATAMVALAVSTELTATLLLAPIGTTTLATEFWSEASSVAYGAAAPYALALVLLAMPATILLGRSSRGVAR
ncbi:iron ABC transporter permease [Nocardioides sp. NPDC023903]|uniref:ABC transporter permease n=1 Tax=Nocardioides sp. NPDC023903 TaxID=3157195 RepID=UPI0033C6CED3